MKKNNRFLRGIGKVLFFICDFMGIRYIAGMIITPKDDKTGKRKPITFFLWFVGIYIALFGIASQRYENRINIIEDRISSINAGLNAPQYKKALNRIAETQNMPCPAKPDILKPHTTLISLFRDDIYWDGAEILKTIIENWSDSIPNINLNTAILNEAKLEGAKMAEADLSKADLCRADLCRADMTKATLEGANLCWANMSSADLTRALLTGANLCWANLGSADLTGAYLSGADLRGANLEGANLTGAYLSGVDLSEANLKGGNLTDTVIALWQLKNANSLKDATMMDGTPYDESWAEKIAKAEMPEDYKKRWNLP